MLVYFTNGGNCARRGVAIGMIVSALINGGCFVYVFSEFGKGY